MVSGMSKRIVISSDTRGNARTGCHSGGSLPKGESAATRRLAAAARPNSHAHPRIIDERRVLLMPSSVGISSARTSRRASSREFIKPQTEPAMPALAEAVLDLMWYVLNASARGNRSAPAGVPPALHFRDIPDGGAVVQKNVARVQGKNAIAHQPAADERRRSASSKRRAPGHESSSLPPRLETSSSTVSNGLNDFARGPCAER